MNAHNAFGRQQLIKFLAMTVSYSLRLYFGHHQL